MLLSEHLILEALHEDIELIFDRPDLVKRAKQVFVNGYVSCHALDLERHKESINKAVHKFAIRELFKNEFNEFVKRYNEYAAQYNYAETHGDYVTARNIKKRLLHFVSECSIPTDVPRKEIVDNLYPCWLQSNGNIACIYVTTDKASRILVYINPTNNTIATAFKCRQDVLDARIVKFASNELLNLKVYGTLDVKPADTYAAIKSFETSLLTNTIKDKMLSKFFALHKDEL